MTMNTSQSFKRWFKRLETNCWEQSICNAWAHNVVAIAHGDTFVRSTLTYSEANHLLVKAEQMYPFGINITDEHTKKGHSWLRSQYKLNGVPRKNCHPSAYQIDYADIDNVSYTFDPECDVSDNGYRISVVPMWNWSSGLDVGSYSMFDIKSRWRR